MRLNLPSKSTRYSDVAPSSIGQGLCLADMPPENRVGNNPANNKEGWIILFIVNKLILTPYTNNLDYFINIRF